MGEAGCGKTFLLRLVARLVGAFQLQEKQVHAGTSIADIANAVAEAENDAARLEDPDKFCMVFFDELNTCPHLPLFKRLLVDRVHPVTGKRVHKQVRFVAACNPWRSADKTIVSVGFESPVSADDKLAGLAYRVHPLPESLFGFLSSFGQLDKETERTYVERMSAQDPLVLDASNEQLQVSQLTKSMQELASNCVATIHGYFRDVLGISVSLRDPSRFLKLWGFIRWEGEQRSR